MEHRLRPGPSLASPISQVLSSQVAPILIPFFKVSISVLSQGALLWAAGRREIGVGFTFPLQLSIRYFPIENLDFQETQFSPPISTGINAPFSVQGRVLDPCSQQAPGTS